MEAYFRSKAEKIKGAKIKEEGSVGLEFDFEVGPLRKSSSMKNTYLQGNE